MRCRHFKAAVNQLVQLKPTFTRQLVAEADGGVFDQATGQFVESDEAFRKRILGDFGEGSARGDKKNNGINVL